jgi:hypothetical protein
MLDPMTPAGQPAGAAATDVYGAVSNVTVKVLAGEEDAVQVVADWARGH